MVSTLQMAMALPNCVTGMRCPLRRLATSRASLTLLTAIRKRSTDVFPVHSLRLCNQDILRLPDPLLPSIFPCMMSCSRE
ncbi:uncharacterized protein LOC120354476 isoform X4 [Nilaparvata lugens]|uniref:uncharacterized protein LOC120354476 isoform X4 n=1 Tax=Nilaparvata lugens TaxID=108931 RepID=UPI00193DF761|nr:uncharacterized protein LOC120354476 isoform X4 [Nilaparvata lugens]